LRSDGGHGHQGCSKLEVFHFESCRMIGGLEEGSCCSVSREVRSTSLHCSTDSTSYIHCIP
jgi:hypothetical protein